MDQTFWNGLAHSIVTRALAQAAALAVAGGWITDDQSTKLILYASGGIVSLVIYGYTWFRNKQAEKLTNTQIKVALNASSSTPVSVVKAEAVAFTNKS